MPRWDAIASARAIGDCRTCHRRPSCSNKSVKRADRPDSVRSTPLRERPVTAIPLGRASLRRLGATYPHTPRARSSCAYLVLLRVEIARFTRRPFGRRLVSVALILTSRWTAVGCYAALCSPDLPPVRPFGTCTSGGLARFTGGIIPGAGGRRSGRRRRPRPRCPATSRECRAPAAGESPWRRAAPVRANARRPHRPAIRPATHGR